MAPNNSDNNDELRRRESAKAQEANNNTDTSQNDTNAGEEGGEAGQKVVNYLWLIPIAKYSCIISKDCIKKSLKYSVFVLFRDFHIQSLSDLSSEMSSAKDSHFMEWKVSKSEITMGLHDVFTIIFFFDKE